MLKPGRIEVIIVFSEDSSWIFDQNILMPSKIVAILTEMLGYS